MKDKGERQLWMRAPSPSPSSLSLIPVPSSSSGANISKVSRSCSSTSGPPIIRIRPGICPIRVLSRNSKTAAVARSSPGRTRMGSARGSLHSQSLSTLHSVLIPGAHRRHLAKRWNLVCLSPFPHHQHCGEAAWPILVRCSAVAACPERSWKKRPASSFLALAGPFRIFPLEGGR